MSPFDRLYNAFIGDVVVCCVVDEDLCVSVLSLFVSVCLCVSLCAAYHRLASTISSITISSITTSIIVIIITTTIIMGAGRPRVQVAQGCRSPRGASRLAHHHQQLSSCMPLCMYLSLCFCVSLYVSVCLSVSLYVSVCLCVSLYVSVWSLFVSVCLYVCSIITSSLITISNITTNIMVIIIATIIMGAGRP